MKKEFIFFKKKIAILFLISFVILLSGCAKNNSSDSASKSQSSEKSTQVVADKVEVFYFHSTQRCVSCMTLEEFTNNTIYEFFQSDLRDGKIKFQSINIDLPENIVLTNKYQARGSSLYINSIYEDKDHIMEDVNVWRFLSNETQFKNYLKNKLINFLGK